MWPTFLSKITLFAAIGDPCNPNAQTNPFFGFPVWWKYIKNGEMDGFGKCTPKVDFPDGLWAIGFAVIDMLLYLGGIVAVIAIIIAGISFITSSGNVEKTTAARRRIVQALIGLAIVVMASVLVGFIGNQFA